MTTITKHRIGVIAAAFVLFGCGSAHGDIIHFQSLLSGPAEAPPNSSPGQGIGNVFYDNQLHTMRVQTTFFDLIGNTTTAHIHAPTVVPFAGTAGVATQVPVFIGFPLGVPSGAYDHTFDLTDPSSYNPAFLNAQGGTPASAEAALVGALNSGQAYLNIHSSAFPGGEIRGFPTRVPDNAATGTLLALGILALIGSKRFLTDAKTT